MPNPNTICPACDTPIYRNPARLKMFRKHYCNSRCLRDEKYHWLPYILANRSQTPKVIAAHIGIPVNSFRTWIYYINRELPADMRITYKKGPPKTAIPKPTKEKKPKPVKTEKPVTVKPERKNTQTMRRPPKPEFTPKKVIPFNPATHTMMKVNGRTWKHVLKTTG